MRPETLDEPAAARSPPAPGRARPARPALAGAARAVARALPAHPRPRARRVAPRGAVRGLRRARLGDQAHVRARRGEGVRAPRRGGGAPAAVRTPLRLA